MRFGPHERALLLYDRWNGLVGVAPARSATANSFPIFDKTNGRHRVIRAGRFFRYYGIVMPRTMACKAEIDDDKLDFRLPGTEINRVLQRGVQLLVHLTLVVLGPCPIRPRVGRRGPQ